MIGLDGFSSRDMAPAAAKYAPEELLLLLLLHVDALSHTMRTGGLEAWCGRACVLCCSVQEEWQLESLPCVETSPYLQKDLREGILRSSWKVIARCCGPREDMLGWFTAVNVLQAGDGVIDGCGQMDAGFMKRRTRARQ